jgi:hypothetical protein
MVVYFEQGAPIMKLTFTEQQVAEQGNIPEITAEFAAKFLSWLLSEKQICRRSQDPRLRRRAGLLSAHVSRQKCTYLHGSDIVERIYVAVRVLQRCGLHNRRACAKVVRLLPPELLGGSLRGRPSKKAKLRINEFSRKVETVRSLVNSFSKKQHPWRSQLPERDLLVAYYVAQFLWLQERDATWRLWHEPSTSSPA